MLEILGWFLSATFMIIDRRKFGLSRKEKTDLLRKWNFKFICYAVVVFAATAIAECLISQV